MVSLTISTKGKPKVSVDFPDRHPEQVTVKQLHQAVHAKFPVVSSDGPPPGARLTR